MGKTLFTWTEHSSYLTFGFPFQDSTKINDLEKECENSKNLIPELEESIPKLQKLLLDEEKVLEEIKENSKGVSIFSIMKNMNMLCCKSHFKAATLSFYFITVYVCFMPL